MHPTSDPDFDGLIASFARSLRAKNRSPRTQSAYLDTVRRFAAYCAANGLPTDLAAITRAHVEDYIADQLERFTPSTAATRYRCLQQFFRFAVEEGEIEVSPMAKMTPPTQGEKPVPVLTDDELRDLFRACEGRAFEDRRDTAIVRLFVDTGIRRGEMAGIAVEDILMRVEHFPAPGTKVSASNYVTVGGGCAANAAVAIARLFAAFSRAFASRRSRHSAAMRRISAT